MSIGEEREATLDEIRDYAVDDSGTEEVREILGDTRFLLSELDRVTAERDRFEVAADSRKFDWSPSDLHLVIGERDAALALVEKLRERCGKLALEAEDNLERARRAEGDATQAFEHMRRHMNATLHVTAPDAELTLADVRAALAAPEMECGEGLLCGEGEHDQGCGVFVAAAALATDAGKTMLEEVSMLRGVMQRERESGFSGRQRKALETELAATRERAEKAERERDQANGERDYFRKQYWAVAHEHRAKGLEEAAKVAEAEPEYPTDWPAEKLSEYAAMIAQGDADVLTFVRTAVGTTKESIAAKLRALAKGQTGGGT